MMPTFELKGVTKSFGRVAALRGIDFKVMPGEIVGLLGDNGAGKSTLVRIISGVHAPDEGELYFKGERRVKWNARLARTLGIETVHQDRALAEQQSVAQNIFLGREITNPLGFIDIRRQNEEARALMRSIGFTSRVFNERSPVELLSGGERQGVAIARALHFKAQLIMLDEPTNALAVREVDRVLDFVRRIKQEGRSAIFISHNISHAHAVCDRIVLLDRGLVVQEHQAHEIALGALIGAMQDLSHAGRIA